MNEAARPGSPTVLVVGAHAFDAEAMAGGLCATLAAAGSRVVLVHLSNGEQGHPRLAPAEYDRQKRAEAERAAGLLGAEARFLKLPDTRIPVSDLINEQVARLIREIRPEIAIGHWKGSWHKDHRAAHEAFMNGIFYAALPTILPDLAAFRPTSVLFAENWEDAEGFIPSEYHDIGPGYERWLAAMDAYELCSGDLAIFPYRDYYTSLARLRGCLSGHRYAAALMPLESTQAMGLGIFTAAVASRPATR